MRTEMTGVELPHVFETETMWTNQGQGMRGWQKTAGVQEQG